MAKKEKEKTLKSQGSSELSDLTAKLTKYYEDNGLDPKKDWSKDKKHGEAVSKLKKKIKIAKMKFDAGVADEQAEKANKKPDVKPEKVKTVKKQPASYDYPDVDGKPMTPELKKRYRSKMRSLLKANMDPKVAQEKALASVMGTAENKFKKEKTEKAEAPKPSKKEVVVKDKKKKPKDKKTSEAPVEKAKLKKKKQAKEED